MIPYWIIFGIPAVVALQEQARPWIARRSRYYVSFWLILSLFIGLRYQVGGDWVGYLRYLSYANSAEFHEIFLRKDPGYIALNWIATRLGFGIAFVNLICAVLFSTGLIAFARRQPRPWLAILIAIPYLVIVVAMGYTRQGAAIGLVMLGLTALIRGRMIHFLFWVAIATTFHRTAIFIIPLAMLASATGRMSKTIWVGVVGTVLYFTFLDSSVERLIDGYILAEYDSEGAFVRVMMNALPAVIFIRYHRRLKIPSDERKVIYYMSIAACLAVAAFFISPSSTAVDRLGLYLIPLQIYVLSRLQELFDDQRNYGNLLSVCVVVYSAAVLFTWLNFASHAKRWVPYQIVPFLI